MVRLFAFSLIASLGLAACGGSSSDASVEDTAADASSAAASTQEDTARELIPAPEGSLAGGAMVIGSPDAPLTIIEYASMVCPGCAGFHTQIFPAVKEQFVDTGLVRFEFREFPTNPKNLAYAGAYLARCAATERGPSAYFTMVNALFERQRDWAYGPTPGTALQEIASQAGIDRESLEECFYREDVRDAVENNIEVGIREHRIGGTPSFVVDDEPFDWDSSRGADGMIEAIEAALAERQ